MADPPTRRYDNRLRRERADATRASIVEAGCDLVHDSDVRDWRGLTVVAVAARAGVSERTVYRHFATELGLRDAVMRRLEERAGVDLSTLELDGVADAAGRILAQLRDFRPTSRPPDDPMLVDTHRRQRDALLGAVGKAGASIDDSEHVRAAAVLDVLWSVATYERLVGRWSMSHDDAVSTVAWAIGLVTDAVGGPHPGSTQR